MMSNQLLGVSSTNRNNTNNTNNNNNTHNNTNQDLSSNFIITYGFR